LIVHAGLNDGLAPLVDASSIVVQLVISSDWQNPEQVDVDVDQNDQMQEKLRPRLASDHCLAPIDLILLVKIAVLLFEESLRRNGLRVNVHRFEGLDLDLGHRLCTFEDLVLVKEGFRLNRAALFFL
jgi:hypothetical protein